MENNEIMNNEEEITTEVSTDVIDETEHNSLVTIAIVGAAMVAGGLAHKFIVEPAVAKVKNWKKNKFHNQVDNDDYFDADFTEDFEDETEEN